MEEKKFSFCSSIRSSYKLSSQLKKLGAQVGFVVNSETDFVVCSTEEFEKGVSYKIKCAKKYNVCIVEEQFVLNCIEQKSIDNSKQFILWSSEFEIENEKNNSQSNFVTSNDIDSASSTTMTTSISKKWWTSMREKDQSRPMDVRIFISSTFLDMKKERELVMTKVLPALSKLCQERGVFVSFVDLRWGITVGQSKNGETLRTCLREVHRCRPYFVAFLGERYGWAQHASSAPDTLLKRTFELAESEPGFEWLSTLRDRSMTELEIEYALFRNFDTNDEDQNLFDNDVPRQLVFLRNSAYAIAQERRTKNQEFVDQNEESKAKLNNLKQKICSKLKLIPTLVTEPKEKAIAREYRHPDDIVTPLLSDLTRCIEKDFPLTKANKNALTDESDAQYSFSNDRTRVWVANDDDLAQLDSFVNADASRDDTVPRVMLVTGARGCGKSALLANWCERRWRDTAPPTRAPSAASPLPLLLHSHHVGCTPAGSGLARIVALLADRVAAACGVDVGSLLPSSNNSQSTVAIVNDGDGGDNDLTFDNQVDELMSDDVDLSSRFGELLALASDRFERVVIVLDNLDLMMGIKQRGAKEILSFIPSRPAANVRIIVSAGCPLSKLNNKKLEQHKYVYDDRGAWAVFDTLLGRCDTTLVAAGFGRGGQSLAQAKLSAGDDTQRNNNAAVEQCASLRCRVAGKHLAPALLQQLSRNAACQTSPRFLTLLLDELLAVGAHDTLATQLQSLLSADDIPSLCDALVRRWSTTHGDALIRDCICLMWMARDGLSEPEIKALLGVSDVQWSQLLATLGDHVVWHRGLLTLNQKDLKKVVKRRFMPTRAERSTYDRRLATFFFKREATARNCRELCHHLTHVAKSSTQNSSDVELNSMLIEAATDAQRVWRMQRIDVNALVALWRASLTIVNGGEESLLKALHDSLETLSSSDVTSAEISSRKRAAALMLSELAHYDDAAALLRQALELDKFMYGGAHVVIVRELVALARVQEKKGELKEAQLSADAARTIAERLGGGQQQSCALEALLCGARTAKKLGEYDAARDLIHRALELHRNDRVLPPLPSVDQNAQRRKPTQSELRQAVLSGAVPLWTSLADIERKQGNIELAALLYEQSLSAIEIMFGNHSIRLAPLCRALGIVAKKRAQYEIAERWQRRALSLTEQHFGASHPDCVEFLVSLGDIERKRGSFKTALDTYDRAARLVREHHGNDHIDLAEITHAKAVVLKKLARYGEAAELLRLVLTQTEAHFSANHVRCGVVQRDLADVLRKQDKLDEARELYDRALSIVRSALGQEHDEVADILNSIGLVEKRQAKYTDAEKKFRQAISIVRKVYGNEHAKIGLYLGNVADIQRKQGDLTQAIKTYENALKVVGATLGESHIEHAELRVRLARALAAKRQYSRADTILGDALAAVQLSLGDTHPKVGEFGICRADILREQGRLDEARRVATSAVAVVRASLGADSIECGEGERCLAAISLALREDDDAREHATRARTILIDLLNAQHPKVIEVDEILKRLL